MQKSKLKIHYPNLYTFMYFKNTSFRIFNQTIFNKLKFILNITSVNYSI